MIMSSREFTTAKRLLEREICNSEISQSIRLNKIKGRKMANETATAPNIFSTTKIHS